jgi:glutamate 5-kinase
MVSLMEKAREILSHARRIVIKTGSALLTDEHGRLNKLWLDALAADIAALMAMDKEIILVASGAVALGRSTLNLKAPLKLEQKQAAAALGQTALMQGFCDSFARQNLHTAQLLLTLDVTENRRSYLNARATMEALLAQRVIPVINENDTVATAELRYGDNDRLSAHVAQMAGAHLLILLSDVDGLYSADPRQDVGAKHISLVEKITPEIMRLGGKSSSSMGSGGMATKLEAATIANAAGCSTIIAKGTDANPIANLQNDNPFTLFLPQGSPASARRQWIAHRLKPSGALTIDEGAANALKGNKSLLAAGIAHCDGDFLKGDAVQVLNANGQMIAQGLVNLDRQILEKYIGKSARDSDFNGIAIHKNNLVSLGD